MEQDWQLAQSPEESWRECHLHARNLQGEAGHAQLLAEIEGREESTEQVAEEASDDIERDLFGNPVEIDLFGEPHKGHQEEETPLSDLGSRQKPAAAWQGKSKRPN